MSKPSVARALLIIDVQNDFCAGGSLAVPSGSSVIPVIASLRARAGAFFTGGVFATQDWHSADHMSFASSHPPRAPFDSIEMPYGPQTLWPDHCVAGSKGARFADGLDLSGVTVVRKGTDVLHDSYSGFEDNAGAVETELDGLLRAAGVGEVYVCGLALDFCVRFTALHAVKRGYDAFLVEDACRGICAKGCEDAMREMRAAGVTVVSADFIGR